MDFQYEYENGDLMIWMDKEVVDKLEAILDWYPRLADVSELLCELITKEYKRVIPPNKEQEASSDG